jgi:tetratricopeptide (TPR) repeat protein
MAVSGITRCIFIVLAMIFQLSEAYTQQLSEKFDDLQYLNDFGEIRLIFHRAYFEEASRRFGELLETESSHAFSYAYAAMTDYMLYRDPNPNANRAKSMLNLKDQNYHFIKALLRFVENDFTGCEAAMLLHLEKNPDDVYAMHVLGFTRIDMDKASDGLATLNTLIKKHPEYFPAYNHIGYAYLELNKNDKAVVFFKKFLQADSLNPSAYDSYADGLAAMGEYDKAIAQLTKAVLIEPDFAYAWKHMGDLFEKQEYGILAYAAYEKALKASDLYGDNFVIQLREKLKN